LESAVTPRQYRSAGVTLFELLIVVGLVALLAGITFPSMAAGVETLRLNQASNDLVSFLNDALIRAERREQAVEITISKAGGTLSMRTAGSAAETKTALPQGVSIARILPGEDPADGAPRHFIVYPGGAVPRIAVEITNSKGARRIVRVDPITGVPRVENPGTAEAK
jgi:type II secretory pathway pseudopilin PulG